MKPAQRIGDVMPLADMLPGSFAELVDSAVRYDVPGSDVPLFSARVRVMSQLKAGTFVEGWLAANRWGGMVPAPLGALGRIVDRDHVVSAWGVQR